MLRDPQAKRDLILEVLREHGPLTVAQISGLTLLKLSSIRRHLYDLERERRVTNTHPNPNPNLWRVGLPVAPQV